MQRNLLSLVFLTFLLLDAHLPAFSQKNNKKVFTSIAAKTSGMQKFEGYFDFYYDSQSDKIYIAIDKPGQEFLYVNSLAAGVGSNDIGLDRGQLGSERIVKFDRRGQKVLLIQPNYKYRASTNNPDERQAVAEAFAQSVLWGFTVCAEEKGKILVDATDFLLRDAHGVAGTLKSTGQGSYKVNESMSAIYMPRTKSFPENTEFEATITLTGSPAGAYIKSVTPTPKNVTVRQHHSFVKLPDSGYQPRAFDPRAGYFSISYFDYATPIYESITKRLITRHRLEKKDPKATVSEAKEPIIYYLDRGTPEPIRSALMDGAMWWNQAFEAIGFKNAFQVKMLPEGADPMDVRYNVIQWVHRSTRGWSYGASVTDPRTGEIIKGHVSLGSLRVRQDFLIAEGLLAPYKTDKVPDAMQKMALARIRQLAAHEVGHTLGLAHSYTSSTESRASVMDYPHPLVKITDGKIDLSAAYDDKIGAWDKVAIAYGYSQFTDGQTESTELEKIIQNSLKAGLTFLSDQDARPLGGAHPYAHLWDNGKNPVDELTHVMKVRAIALKQFGENNLRPSQPMAMLEEVLVPVYFFHRYQTEAAVKLIGGLNYRYAIKGDGQLVTEKVPAALQKEALNALLETVSPEALALPEKLLQMIPPRPLGYDRGREVANIRTELTFDALGVAESAAGFVLSQILHPARTGRLVEYHARDADQLSLEEVLDVIIEKTWKAPVKSGYAGALQRAVGHMALHHLMKLANDNSASSGVRAIVKLKVGELKAWMKVAKKTTKDEALKAHLTYHIDFKPNPEKKSDLAMPPGSPIGLPAVEFCSWQ